MKACFGRKDVELMPFVALFFFLSCLRLCDSFSTPLWSSRRRPLSRLNDLSEWREQTDEKRRHLLLLPFREDEALLPGMSSRVVLTHGRFMDLFQDAIDEHQSILGMVLMGQDEVRKEIVLCEIIDYEVNAGFRGKITIDVSLKSVGRAAMLELTQMQPVMSAVCEETVDKEVELEGCTLSTLLNEVESVLLELGLYDEYTVAFRKASDALENSDSTLSFMPIQASSWAVCAVCSDRSILSRALACSNAQERLELGLRALFEMKLNRTSARLSAEESGGVHFQ